jgi:putative phosphoribosyl transferase
MRFRDRQDAGRTLAELLSRYHGQPDVLVLGLPRGGVPVARVVADTLGTPMDVFLVRKLGVPGHEELAMGAIAAGDVVVLNDDLVSRVPRYEVDLVIQQEARELRRRDEAYRQGRPLPRVDGRTVILVDDGLATGASMKAAVQAINQSQPGKVVVAVPVAPRTACAELATMVDEVHCAVTPDPFGAVGQAYRDFGQVTDREVRKLLPR